MYQISLWEIADALHQHGLDEECQVMENFSHDFDTLRIELDEMYLANAELRAENTALRDTLEIRRPQHFALNAMREAAKLEELDAMFYRQGA